MLCPDKTLKWGEIYLSSGGGNFDLGLDFEDVRALHSWHFGCLAFPEDIMIDHRSHSRHLEF